MRLKRLDLKAFGPFTEKPPLDFNSKEPGLHIIFGENEAGKSSSLRALKALLYGFDQRTSDNFIHNYNQLLVGGCLVNSAGEEIVFQRRKKRIGDLIDESGNPLDPSSLAPFLNGVEPDIFESLYGIDHDTLIKGGEEILAQKGEVGQALFSAGAGISSLKEVIDQLEKEAVGLFKSAGQLPEINKAVKRFRELQKKLRENSLSSRIWKDHQKNLKLAETERADLEKERDQNYKEIQRIDRLIKAIPELASLKNLQKQQSDLGTVVKLPIDFAEKYQKSETDQREAKQQLARDEDRLEKLEKRLRQIVVNEVLLNQAEIVDDFHQRLGEYRKGQKDIPLRDGMRISLRREAAILLKQVRPDLDLGSVETLRPILSKKKTIQALSSQYEAINQQLLLAQKKVTDAEKERDSLEKLTVKKPEVLEPVSFMQAVKLAQKVGDIDAQLEKGKIDIEIDKENCLTELQRIGLWSGELTMLMRLSFPLSETVQQFEKEYNDIAEEKREIQKELKIAENDLKQVSTDIKKIVYSGNVPSEEELMLTREKREQGWQLLKREWINQESVVKETEAYNPELSLSDAYENYVEKADTLADRLRREADRVANAASLKAKEETLIEVISSNNKKMAALKIRTKEFDESWLSAWQSSKIMPLSPKEMIGWLAEIEKLRFKVGDIQKKEQEIETIAQQRGNLKEVLKKELDSIQSEGAPTGEKLGPILIFAETVLDQIARQKADLEKLKERQKKADDDYSQAKEDFKVTQEALDNWQEQWKKAFMDLGVNDVSTIEAIDLIEILQNCFSKLKEADDFKKRIDGIKRDATELELAVNELLEEVTPDMRDLPLDQAILKLRKMVGEAQKERDLHEKLSEEISSLREEVSVAKKSVQETEKQIGELIRIAQCEKAEELAPAIAKFNEYKRLQEKISDTQTTLARIGAGVDYEDLAQQALEVNADELPGLIQSLKQDVDDRVNPEINRISQVIGEENNKLAMMDGRAAAAETAEEMEEELSRIRRLAERYSLLKLSSKILQQEIERYREENQDPILKIASEYFQNLTMGSFVQLRTDVDDNGEPILVGVRSSNTRLTVNEMSSGTRDQLFLALRLATLEWRLDANEPMPFIVDDILINFDDERSKATLKALADLSKKNQVILFTHHTQIVEDAKALQENDLIKIHTL